MRVPCISYNDLVSGRHESLSYLGADQIDQRDVNDQDAAGEVCERLRELLVRYHKHGQAHLLLIDEDVRAFIGQLDVVSVVGLLQFPVTLIV